MKIDSVQWCILRMKIDSGLNAATYNLRGCLFVERIFACSGNKLSIMKNLAKVKVNVDEILLTRKERSELYY